MTAPAYYATLPDRELVRRLRLVRAQEARAYARHNGPALERLMEWEADIIRARMARRDNSNAGGTD